MKRLLPLLAMVLVAAVGVAKDKSLPLSGSDAATLRDQTVTVSRHEKPSFVAGTAGKAAFALLGTAAMISSGNAIVRDNEIADPADIIEQELVATVISHYGMVPPAGPAPVIKEDSLKQLLAYKVDTDYLLDVRSIGWSFTYYPAHWGKYWVGYGVQVQLIDKRSSKLVSNMACNTSTHKQEPYPTKEALLADNAQLLKDSAAALGWHCVHQLAKEQFRLPDEVIAATPDQYVDPAAAYLVAHPDSFDVKDEPGKGGKKQD